MLGLNLLSLVYLTLVIVDLGRIDLVCLILFGVLVF